VNNAGVFPIAEIRDTTVQLWDWVYAVNVRGPFVCAQEAIPHFRKRGWRVNRQHRLHDAFPLPQ
jgi:NAD(P)-dependent dehydrogenase (short-subunit alcohol dehydrogenase family)